MITIGIFVIIVPTGTGWVDPAAMDSVEYLHHGDVASVAQQYSYLSSPLSLLLQPEYGSEAAKALCFRIRSSLQARSVQVCQWNFGR